MLALTVLNYRLSRSVLYPPFIFCFMWVVDTFLYSLHLVRLDRVHEETFLVICSGALLFTLGGVLAKLVPGALIRTRFVLIGQHLRPLADPLRTRWIKYFLMVLVVIGTLYVLHVVMGLAAYGTGSNFLARARNAGTSSSAPSDEHSFILPYVILWAIYLSVLFQLEERDKTFWLMAVLAFIASILSGDRTHLLLMISAVTGMYLLKNDRLTFRSALRFIRWPALFFILLWVALIFVNKDTSGFGSSVAGVAELFLVSYIVGPTAALDYFLRHQAEYAGAPEHTFKFFLTIASSLHLIHYTPPPTFDTFVQVPFPTNVYTVYKFYIADFGLYGALGTMLVIGFLHTLLYRKARTGSKLAMYFFSLTLFPLILVIFDDQYSAFGSYIDILLVGSLYFFIRSERMLGLPKLSQRRIRES